MDWQWFSLFSMVSINTIVNLYRLWDYKRKKPNETS
jgi:hypothetical protein